MSGLIIGRAVQGAGAIASTLMALVSDLTSEENRTKAMAAIGASIGLSFMLAMIMGRLSHQLWGCRCILGNRSARVYWYLFFWLRCRGLQSSAIARPDRCQADWTDLFSEPNLWRLNFGIFALHLVLMAALW